MHDLDEQPKSFERNFPLGLTWDAQTSRRIYGPPGTGKTTTLIEIAKNAIQKGMNPENIGYFAFTNVAADEAKEKILKVIEDSESKFANFSTLHSLTTRMGGTEGKQLCQREHLQKFDLNIGAREEWLRPGDPTSVVVRPIHPVLSEYSIMINKKLSEPSFSGKSLDDAQMLLSKFFKLQIQSNQILEFAEKYYRSYENFKLENNLADFNDVVFSVAKDEFPEEKIPTFELLIIDEAQDLSALQWEVVSKLSKKAKETILAGDDDQAIMISFGAAPKLFNEFPTSLPDEVLSTSWRLPKKLKSYVDRNVNFKDDVGRKEKIWVENPDAKFDGQITNSILSGDDPSDPLKSRSITLGDLVRIIANRRQHEWLVMAPTRATCEKVSNGLRALNVPHFLHRQDVISSDSKIFVQTIHTSKGMGVENVAVVLLTRGDTFLLEDKRLLYVALTRAKKELFIVQK